jgi:N-acetylmuramoyl-L-alanine amidase
LEFVVLHGTWMRDDEDALARLCDPVAEVSCHYYITRGGQVIQLVGEERVAFHAGKSQAVGADGVVREGLNGWSLGIEIGNAGPFVEGVPDAAAEAKLGEGDWAHAEPYTAEQYVAVIALLKDILARNKGISASRVLGHDAVSPGRKSDPGKHFDWQKLRDAGVCA